MGQVLYRKYRSRSFDEIVGQDHITSVLKRALEQDKVAHAYLFTGPRGVGKTSIARILAHEINKLPYSDNGEQLHLDIIEIDAASNRRIDEIRDLREKVHLSPTSAPYKVYIIDEVHMLTTEAFNALLKTLEEPPEHVIFILATTESHKVPDTIISRTQRFHFRPIDAPRLAKHLASIAKKEKIAIQSDALHTLAVHAKGSFRDGLSLLDQVAWHEGEVTQQVVETLLGLAPADRIENLLTAIISGDISSVFTALAAFYEEGIGPADIARSLSRAARDQYLGGHEASDLLIDIADGLIEVEESYDPLLKLETTLVRLTSSTPTSTVSASEPLPLPAATPPVVAPEPAEEPMIETTSKESSVAVAQPSSPKSSASPGAFDWTAALQQIKSAHEPLYALLRMCDSDFDPMTHKLTLTFRFGFHQKRVAGEKNRQILGDILAGQLGSAPELVLVIDATSQPPKKTDALEQGETVGKAADILGGDIVELPT
jgi:DNA polymerase-3 subunit gamma/tau